MPQGMRKDFYIDRNPNGGMDHLTHARAMLSQVYYRQNMYVQSSQYCDAKDMKYYLGPIVFVTAFSSLLGFCASSALLAEATAVRSYVSLLSGLLGVAATTVTSLRNAAKMDVKAEMFRGAAGQYRLMATRLEERIRTHRNLMMQEEWKDKLVRENEIALFSNFFVDNYKVILTSQSEMKYFPPGAAVKMWKKKKMLIPNEIDQPEIDRGDMIKLQDEFA